MENTHANVIAGASSGLQRAANGLGAEVIALLEVAEAQVEITLYWDRSGERAPERVALRLDWLLPEEITGIAVSGSRLAMLLKDAVAGRSQSFLLFPLQTSRKAVTGVIGFSAAKPPISEAPDAVVDNLNLLGWATWSAREIERLRGELRTASERLAGRKLVERAKSTLQAERSISEEQAYEYLRSLSRRRRITLAQLSSEILGGRQGAIGNHFPD